MAIYYRATTIPMPIGENLAAKTDHFSDNAERRRLENFLEKRKPPESHSRLSSWFACDSPARAVRYLEAQLGHENKCAEVLLFSVQMLSPSKQPMALIDAILTALREDDTEKAEFLTKEYWQPKHPWKFWEYTSTDISKVVAKVEPPDEIMKQVAWQDYSVDHSRIKRLLAERREPNSKGR